MKMSKTDFLSYLECKKNVWVKWHKKDVYDSFPVSAFEQALGEMGNNVEEVARSLFPNGVFVSGRGEDAQEITRKLIHEKCEIIFQPVFTTEKYLAACDILKYNKDSAYYDIYEVKMSSVSSDEESENQDNKKNDEKYLNDLAFQVNVLSMCGLCIDKKYLIELDKNYVKKGPIYPNKLFVIQDKTREINDFESLIKNKMTEANNYLSFEFEPKENCDCYYKGRSRHCTTFIYSNPSVPKYSVHDLNRIGNSKKLLQNLLDLNILELNDVPLDFEGLTSKPTKDNPNPKPRKINQIQTHISQEPIIDLQKIEQELSTLQFPLYFLDYETYPTAIPIFDGYKPYQQIVFQYSLHVLRSFDSELEHFEFIQLNGDPAENIAKSLQENIGQTGTIITWHKHFENGRAKDLGELLPRYKDFFDSIIERTYDLKDIVENQYFVHPKFMGRSSIKFVLPALFPEMDYKKLDVKSGTDAIEAYRQILEKEIVGQEAEIKRQAMLEYCKLDTLAMVKIWQYFRDLVK